MYLGFMTTRQITFRVSKKLWEEFSIDVLKKHTNKSKILIELIEKYLGKKK